VIPIRSVPWSPPAEVPEWLARDAVRPRVYVTLGTVAFEAVEVLRRAVTETAAHDVDVLVAVGPKGDVDALGEVPDNVHVERFVPQSEVLSRVDLVVHHGGAGTMLGALSHGLPQLILPQGADQFFNAAMITEAHAGRALENDQQVPGAISAAVGALLADGPERPAAKRFADEIAAMPAPADVVAAWGITQDRTGSSGDRNTR
jgi:MGT family glycosyltransferase